MSACRGMAKAVLVTFWLGYGLLLGVRVAISRRETRESGLAEKLAQQWCQRFLNLLQVQVRLAGNLPEGQYLMVANHVSWLDIPVLASLKPTSFLSKAEVRNWPLIGWLSVQAGTLYIARGGGKSSQVLNEIAQRLNSQRSVLVFPEGTTTTGKDVRPFHPRLFAASIEAQASVLPLSLVYSSNGYPDTEVAFVGDDAFFPHLIRLLFRTNLSVDIVVHEPLHPGIQETRTLAEVSHGVVREAVLKAIPPHTASHTIPSPAAIGCSDLAGQCTDQ